MDEFCRDLSHDLNNSLTGIMMTAELLLMSAKSDQEKAYIADIIESVEEMSQIIKARRLSLASKVDYDTSQT